MDARFRFGQNQCVNASRVSGMNWWKYVSEVSGGASAAEVAKRIGISGPSVSRWRESAPKPENVSAFARSYKRPVLEAFVAAGFLTKKEAGERPAGKPSLDQLSNEELLQEIRTRMNPPEYALAALHEDPNIGPDQIEEQT